MTDQKLKEFSKVIQEAKYELLEKLKEFSHDSLLDQPKEEMAESLLFRGQLDAFLYIEQMLLDLRVGTIETAPDVEVPIGSEVLLTGKAPVWRMNTGKNLWDRAYDASGVLVKVVERKEESGHIFLACESINTQDSWCILESDVIERNFNLMPTFKEKEPVEFDKEVGREELRYELDEIHDKIGSISKDVEKLIIDSRRHEVDVMSFSSVGYSRRPLKKGSTSSKLIKIMKKDPEAVYSVSRLIKENKGFNQSTLQSALHSLVRRGSVEVVKRGRYRVVREVS